MIACVATGCSSVESTRINDSPIKFFPFPEDDVIKNQWLRNCDLVSKNQSSDKEPLYLCELHFEKDHFTASRDLKSSAVPTMFERTEESPKKQEAENISPATPMKTPLKRRKLDEHPHALVTPPQSPSIQDNIKDLFSGSKAGDKDTQSMDHVATNGSVISTSLIPENSQASVQKKYRLIIQIDKIRGKPAPRCKKTLPQITFSNTTKDKETTKGQVVQKRRSIRISKKPCAQGKCRLRKCLYKSKLAFQCEWCDKFYIAKKEENVTYSCTQCFKTFSDSQSLYAHIKKHFICDICLMECSSQMSHDKHVRLHVSTDPQYPYKCHQCHKIFDIKESVKKHCLVEHPKVTLQNTVLQVTPSLAHIVAKQNDNYFCMNCNIGFTNDQAYRNHLNSHGNKEGFTCNITSEANNIIPVPNPLTGNQIGILQPVKFTCRVCSKQCDNFDEVNLHTRTHLENKSAEDLKCNICKKFFKSSTEFSEHLKHHLSRAYPCPICSKAFINKTTLNIHLKTHSTPAQ